MIGQATLCNECKHLHHGLMGWKCDAYPEEIPAETFWGNVYYHKPYKRNQGPLATNVYISFNFVKYKK